MFEPFRKWRQRRRRVKHLAARDQLRLEQAQRRRLAVRASYDAAQTTTDNTKHWVNADSLSADAAASTSIRQLMRNRCRYEVANNSYARGILLTLANDTVGTGPRLQMMLDNPNTNRIIEREFAAWATAVNLAAKLRTLRIARAQDGEGVALLTTNPRLSTPVQLDVVLVEADRLADPYQLFDDPNNIDGVFLDAHQNPVKYRILKHHPGGNTYFAIGDEYNDWPASKVIHYFRQDRPGQHRGLPEIMPALELFAQLRRYTSAVLAAAESVADVALTIQSRNAVIGEDDEGVEAMDVIELEKRMATILPEGYELGQVRAEQPSTGYGEFKNQLINEIARCLNMPFNIAACNSSEYNYSSGRLDHQTYYKSVSVDRRDKETVCLIKVFTEWFDEATLIPGYLPNAIGRISTRSYQWFWDGHEHVDPVKEARAQEIRLLTNETTTLADECGKEGKDWETVLRQRAKEKALREELDLTDDEAAEATTPAKASHATAQ